MEQHQELYWTKDPGEDTEKEESYITMATFRFFGFNQAIQIEAPDDSSFAGVNLVASSTSSGGKRQDTQLDPEIFNVLKYPSL